MNEKSELKPGPKYFISIEDKEYFWDDDTITVPQIRQLGGLPSDQPVVEIFPDNTERTLGESEIIELKPGHRFGKKIRFKRG
ncbi:MAG: multiubiquitin domain-containing protein [Candidatus Vogelbacteria bacterium]|nr:multiubiquitin domain-containing protein [Candidatus Vogelbacteria bacterium]